MNEQKTVIIAMSPVLNLIIEMLGLHGDDMRIAVFIEDIIYAAKQLMYDVSGDHTDVVVREMLSVLAINPSVYNEVFQLSINTVKDFLNTLVIYGIVNENIYVMDMSRNQIVMNTYSFFIDNKNTDVTEKII